MARYYVNMLATQNGEHEVHHVECEQFPDFQDVLPLGEFTHVEYAVREAAKTFPQSIACQYCSEHRMQQNNDRASFNDDYAAE